MISQTNNNTTMDPILLCGDVSLIKVPHFFRYQDQEIEIVQRASIAEALSFVNQSKCSGIVFLSDSLSGEAFTFLSQMRFIQPQAPLILATNNLKEEVVIDGINRGNVFRFIQSPMSFSDFEADIRAAIDRNSVFQNRTNLLKKASLHNRELEGLTSSLELKVEERTQHVEESNKEQANKLSRERQLIRFIADLSAQSGFEEILQTLRRDMKRFHHLGEPILVFRSGVGKMRFWSFQLGSMRVSEGTESFEFPKEMSIQNSSVLQVLANHFGRPLARAVLLPLDLKMTRLSLKNAEAFLCFENSLNEKELQSFIDFLSERSEALEMVLDRVLLEENLETFSWRWERTFDGMKDPIAIIDMDYNIIRSNSKFSERYYSKKCFSVFANRKTPCDSCPAQEALATGIAQTHSVSINNSIYQVRSYPVKTGEGRASTVMHQYVDVTQSRELYLRMLQSEKMGAIGLLAGNIAHELNNPLTGLRSLSQVLLLESPEGSQLHGDLLEIEKAAARSQKIIKNLLEFSQSDAGVLEIVSIDEIVQKTMPMLKTALRMHRLHLDLETSDVFVQVESHLIQQVVFNLVNNACQAMKEVGELIVRTGLQGDAAFIEVEDNGPGIPDSLHGRIFEAFFTTKQEGQGTGLGLSLSRSVVERFAGTLTLKNVIPHGACFRIELPVVKKNAGKGKK